MRTQSSFLLIAAPLSAQAFIAPKSSTSRLVESQKIAAVPEILASIIQGDLGAIQSQLDLSALQGVTSSAGEAAAALQTQFPILADVPVASAALGVGGFAAGTVAGGGGDQIKLKSLEGDVEKKKKQIVELNQLLEESNSVDAKKQMAEKIDQLEDQIFIMDSEFEQQTGEMMKNMENRVQSEIQKREEKIVEDMKYSFDIKLMKEKQSMLNEKLELSNKASQNEIEMAQMKLKLQETEFSKELIEDSISDAEKEIEKLRSLSESKGFSLFDTGKARIKNSNLEKEIKTVKASLEDKNVQLEEALAEIEQLNSKQSFWSFMSSLASKENAEEPVEAK